MTMHKDEVTLALQTFTWQTRGSPVWQIFDVTMGLYRVATRPPTEAKYVLVPVPAHFAQIVCGYVTVEWAHVPHVDPNRPGLAGVVDGGVLLLDGWHRLAQAQARGWLTLPALLLDAVETAAIRFDPTDSHDVVVHMAAARARAAEGWHSR